MGTLLAICPASEHNLQGHPENKRRLRAVADLIERGGILPDLTPISPILATNEQLTAVHSAYLVELVERASLAGGGHLDADTYTTPDSNRLARIAAGTTCDMISRIMAGDARNGFALVRPPGHHADSNRVGGFCLFNNVAIAARYAQNEWGAKRVAIIDFDVHHGNGTQDIFYLDPSVMYISLHLFYRFFYPGTGKADEIGYGPGQGMTLNVPFMPGAGDLAYRLAMRELIRPKLCRFKPDVILVSAGFDAHWVDPLAAAGLSLSGYAEMARDIISIANDLCHGRVLFVLEGGYHLTALSYGVLNTFYALLGQDIIQDPLGPLPDREADTSRLLLQLQELHLRD